MYIKYPHSFRRNLKVIATGAACIVGAFLIGIQSSGDVQPVSLIKAGGTTIAGDMNGDGILDVSDAIIILEVVNGYTVATSEQLRADPNSDGQLTIDDAIEILSIISLR